MRLVKARVQNYRSIRDTGWFDVEDAKTILVGPNEAGKTAVLEALRRINAPDGVAAFNPLRDYPRKLYSADIQSGRLSADQIPVASARFALDSDDLDGLPAGFENAVYVYTRFLGNNSTQKIEDGLAPEVFTEDVRKDLLRMAAHVDGQTAAERGEDKEAPSTALHEVIDGWQVGTTLIDKAAAEGLRDWLDSITAAIDESDTDENARHTRLLQLTRIPEQISEALTALEARRPVFVYFSTYFRVRPRLHLRNFADRIAHSDSDIGDDYANRCLFKLLGFDAHELARLGDAADPGHDPTSFERYSAQLDERSQTLNAASIRLTDEIRSVWNPDAKRAEADTLRVEVDGQYLKVVVEDEHGVEIEFDQRSGGFQWLVSFFVVFFAEASDAHANAILLLDEPGLSLHGLKQREFQKTLSLLAERNQTLYTTHSPFLVGPNELDLVRVVEMTALDAGTKIHTGVTAGDPAALLPLQEALGYDLAQSLFMQERNFVLEGLTDYWYIDATAQLLRDGRRAALHDRIALVPAGDAGKVVYFATILHANQLKVAALLDSDNAGDAAAKQETLVHTLGAKNILRTADVCPGSITRPEIEDLLRDTLTAVAKDECGWDITSLVGSQPRRPIVDIFNDEIEEFSKYRLAKAYVRWTRDRSADDLTSTERATWTELIKRVNKALE